MPHQRAFVLASEKLLKCWMVQSGSAEEQTAGQILTSKRQEMEKNQADKFSFLFSLQGMF